MYNQTGGNIGNQYGSFNNQNFQTNINVGDFISDELEKFICIKELLAGLDYDKQHECYSDKTQIQKGVFCIEGKAEYGHSLITKYLLQSYFFENNDEKEVVFIAFNQYNQDIISNTCEMLSIPDNEINSIIELVFEWLKLKKVALIFENFPPSEFYEKICLPFIDFFDDQKGENLHKLHLFWLNTNLAHSIEPLNETQYVKIKEFEFVKLPYLEPITIEHVKRWYNNNKRSLVRYNSQWLNKLCEINSELFIKQTEEKPIRVMRKIIDSFGIKYQTFINQL